MIWSGAGERGQEETGREGEWKRGVRREKRKSPGAKKEMQGEEGAERGRNQHWGN